MISASRPIRRRKRGRRNWTTPRRSLTRTTRVTQKRPKPEEWGPYQNSPVKEVTVGLPRREPPSTVPKTSGVCGPRKQWLQQINNELFPKKRWLQKSIEVYPKTYFGQLTKQEWDTFVNPDRHWLNIIDSHHVSKLWQ